MPKADWNPSLHPRDAEGQFTETPGGGGGMRVPPGLVAADQALTEQDKLEPGSGPDNPYRTDNVDDAARALAEGKYVDFTQPRGLSTLTDKLAAIGQEARAKIAAEEERKGRELTKEEKSAILPLYDLGKVTIQGTNLFMNGNKGVPRAEMPQFTGKPEPGSPADSFPRDEHGEVDLSQAYVEHLKKDLGVDVSRELIPAENLRATQSELDGVKVSGMMDAIEAGKLDPTARTIWTTKDDYVLDGHHLWAATVGTEWTSEADNDLPIRSNVIDMNITEALRDAQAWTKKMGIKPRAVGKRDEVPFDKSIETIATLVDLHVDGAKEILRVYVRD